MTNQHYKGFLRGLATASLVLFAASCSANDDSEMSDSAFGPQAPNAGAGGSSASGDGAGLPGAEPRTPTEELESFFESPVATARFIWIANPMSGRVAYIDASSMQVRTTEAGNGPSFVAAVPHPSDDVAVVINTLSKDATIMRLTASNALSTATVPVVEGVNSWAIDSKGTWAIAWADARRADKPTKAQGFQDIAVVRLDSTPPQSTRLSVGYRPSAFGFSADTKHGYAVTQDGISVIDLSGSSPTATKTIATSDNPLEDPGTRDIMITPNGSHALVRRDGFKFITVVTLSDGSRVNVNFPGAVTDLDLAPDGSKAIAVVRDTGDVAILDIPGILSNPSGYVMMRVTQAVVESIAIASQASVGLLYSNTSDQERIAQLRYDTTEPTTDAIRLHAPVLAAFLAPTGTCAIVLHQGNPTTSKDPQVIASSSRAFSVLNLEPQLPARINPTQAPPTAVGITPDGDRAIIAERDDTTGVYGAYLIQMATQQVDRYELASPPIAVGAVLGAKRMFVSQKHPEGRITLIEFETGRALTLTGFELGARVVDGRN